MLKKNEITEKFLCLCLAFIVSDTINVGSVMAFSVSIRAETARATLTTWVAPDGKEKTLVERTTDDELHRFMRKLNRSHGEAKDLDLNGNEVFVNGTLNSLKSLPKEGDRVHIGFGGLHNLTLIAYRAPRFACIFDINPSMLRMYKCLEEAMLSPEVTMIKDFNRKRQIFVEVFIDKLYKAGLLSRDSDAAVSHNEKYLRGLLVYETNWLGNKDYFAIIRKMIKGKRINYACVDALDYTAFAALAQKIKDLKLSVDTVFVSNIFEWISEDHLQDYPVNDPYRNQIRFMASIMSLANTNKRSHVIYSKPRDSGIFIVEGIMQSPMAWYIGRTGNDLVKVMRDIRTHRKMGAIKARSLLKTYSDVKGLSSKKTIGERITFLREQAGMDIGELAHQAGIRRYILQRYEAGKKTPSFLRVCRIADIFNIDPIVLYTGSPRNKALVKKSMTFGKRLKLLRETNGLSVSELRELSGVSVDNIEDYENHEYKYENLDYILRHPRIVYDLATALGEEPSVLYKGYSLSAGLRQEGMTIGKRIQLLLFHFGLSRDELSKKSGVSLATIKRLEHDRSQGKKVREENIDGREAENIYKLAQVFDKLSDSKEFRIEPSILYEGYPLTNVLARKEMNRGERIRYVRIVRGLSQKQLAERINFLRDERGPSPATANKVIHISKHTIVRFENEKLGSPNNQKLKEIADALNVELSMLDEASVIPERELVVDGFLASA